LFSNGPARRHGHSGGMAAPPMIVQTGGVENIVPVLTFDIFE
jgi:hypothetical protein